MAAKTSCIEIASLSLYKGVVLFTGGSKNVEKRRTFGKVTGNTVTPRRMNAVVSVLRCGVLPQTWRGLCVLSLCLLVITVSCEKAAKPIDTQAPFGCRLGWDRLLGWGQDLLGKGQFLGVGIYKSIKKRTV